MAAIHKHQRYLMPLLALAGCASQGPLRPPSLNLPAAVRHLSADRTGNAVELTWTNPAKTSDGVVLTLRGHGAGPLTAEICRGERPPSDHCVPFARIPVAAGTSGRFGEALPAEFSRGTVRPLHYAVRIVNAANAGAVWTPATTLAGTAPSPVRGLRAFPESRGIALRWTAETDLTGIPVLRVVHGDGKPVLLHLPDSANDPGGALDTTGRAGQRHVYTVYRERALQVSSATYTMQSLPAETTVAATAKLPPPPPPIGLEAVVNTLGTPEVDLVWEPADDPSITGYRVYRRSGDGAESLLTPKPVTGFAFADMATQPGGRYSYRVVAVNPTGESSAATATAVMP